MIMMRHPISLLLPLLLSLQTFAQITISGTVTGASDNDPIAGANVLLHSKDGRSLYGFSSTDASGRYSITFSGQADSLRIQITGFNVKSTYRVVKAASQTLDFRVAFEEMSIREVVVKADPITRRSDTLNYYVGNYIDSLDRNIGDVLKKMPGIDVEKSGLIKYNNKPINKFYIEGLDMMGGRYGVATNNVRAKDISVVQVLENHQPIKALQDISFSDDAAINIKLKDKAKGTFAAVLQLGAGYSPWLWNAELAMMQFSAGYQMLCTYKTNNSGDDVTSELTSFYDGLEDDARMLGVRTPSTPDTEKERYMDNMTHAVSLNTLFKLNNDNTLTVNGKYVHDLQKYDAASTTVYYLPEESPLEIREVTSASKLTDEMEVSLKLNKNTEKIYLNEKLTFGADWNRDGGTVLNGPDTVLQKYTLPRLRIKNEVNFIKVLDGISLEFRSVVNGARLPAALHVTPILYPEIFGAAAANEGTALQSVENRKLSTDNYLWASHTFRSRYTVSVRAGFSADLLGMESSLARMDAASVAADSLRNDTYWQRLDGSISVGFRYSYGMLNINAGSNFDYMNLTVDDKVRAKRSNMSRFLIDPSLSLNMKITPSLKFSARGSLSHQIGVAGSNYAGYIMTDYRTISSRDGKIRESAMQNYNAELSYADAIISLFGSVSATYWRSRSNLMYGTRYYGSLSRVESYDIDNLSQGFSIQARVEKRFDDISTTIALPVSYRRTYMDVLRQDEVMKTVSYSIPVGLEVSSRFSRAVRGEYGINYGRSQSIIEDNESKLDPIDALHQRLAFHFTMFKSFTLKVSGEHYFNSAITSGSRSMFFADASILYKTKRFEYILEGRNLLNTDTYNQRIYTDITDYEYSYLLRPISVMFKVKFSIR